MSALYIHVCLTKPFASPKATITVAFSFVGANMPDNKFEIPIPKALMAASAARYREFTRCGQRPLAGGKIFTYALNSTTLKATYRDPSGLTPNTNPVILDAAGEADIYLDGAYRIVVKDKNDVMQKDTDNINSWITGGVKAQLESLNLVLRESMQTIMRPFSEALDVAAAAGAGAKGWHAALITDGNENQKQINKAMIRAVEIASDLVSIKDPYEGQSIFVKSIGYVFIFDSKTSEVDNGVTVVSKWVMSTPNQYLASWFASPNEKKSQALKLQIGYEYATSKNKPFIIDNVYWIDGRAQSFESVKGDKTAIKLISNSTIEFSPSGKLFLIPNNYDLYNILVARNISNVQVYNPVLIGDRLNHAYSTSSTHEWGYGLSIFDDTKNITITDPIIEDMTGDGIYIGREWGTVNTNHPMDIIISNPKISRVRRNGISLTAGDNVKIIKPVIVDIDASYNGTAPMAAIDIEPEEYTNGDIATLKNCVVDSLTAIRVKSPIQTLVSKSKRTIDVRFTGITQLVDSTSGAVLYVYDLTNESQTTKGCVFIENLIVSGSDFNPNIGLKQENFSFVINSLKMDGNINIYIVGKTKEGGSYKNFYIKNIDMKHDAKALYSFYFSDKDSRKFIKPEYYINLPKWMSLGSNWDAIPQSMGKYSYIGGFSIKPNNDWYSNTEFQPANEIRVTPVKNAFIYVAEDYRRLRIKINSSDNLAVQNFIEIGQLGECTYLDALGVEVTKSIIRLTGRDAWIDLQKDASGRTTIYDYYGKLVSP